MKNLIVLIGLSFLGLALFGDAAMAADSAEASAAVGGGLKGIGGGVRQQAAPEGACIGFGRPGGRFACVHRGRR